MFFFSAPVQADSLSLATDLFEKGDWALCRRECRRALLQGTLPIERFQLLDALSAVRMGSDFSRTAKQFEEIIAANTDAQLSAIASYELARLQWTAEQPELAFESFAFAFQNTADKQLFLHAACSLFLLMKEYPALKDGNEALISQINTSRDQWYGALFTQCAKPGPMSTAQPENSGWLVRFYRTQISPAIGDRCTLEPSCSEYFRQAKSQHGTMAFPMVGDRFFREPEVNSRKQDPVVMQNGRIRYQDPIENHDFWMRK